MSYGLNRLDDTMKDLQSINLATLRFTQSHLYVLLARESLHFKIMGITHSIKVPVGEK